MDYKETWIWLPKEKYPFNQTTIYSGFGSKAEGNYTVAEFQKTYDFDKKIVNVQLRFSGDTEFQLYLNGGFIATGPASVGGDYMGNENPRQWFYSYQTEYVPKQNKLDFFARVKMSPVKLCEYSKGKGGFTLSAQVFFADGSSQNIGTDQTWQVRKNSAYKSIFCYDGTIQPDDYVNAEITENVWNTTIAPIPVRTEEEKFPDGYCITLNPNEEKEVCLSFDKIYAGFLHLNASCIGNVAADFVLKELFEDTRVGKESVIMSNGEYRGFLLHSVGEIWLKVKNQSDSTAQLSVSIITTFYPIEKIALTTTSDSELNDVLSVCRHTLQYCRQTHHLDSPRHCEPLACTGDYYIESLMTAFSFGDMRLAEFDIIRTAQVLRHNDGRMFHTTYSLIWVRMLYDVYMITGNINLLYSCRDALDMLLKRFQRYLGENNLIETPPDYMFIDWIFIDGISMHHPPKALGQTCLNMFYFSALNYAAKIYSEIKDETASAFCLEQRESLREAINSKLFDKEKGIYFEGLNTPSPEENIYKYHPQNVEKRYYLKHANILAVYSGVCDYDTSCLLIEKIMSDKIDGDVQPYFAHFLLEGIYSCGFRDKYTLQVLQKWKKTVQDCNKGLVEGFYPPEPGYRFDHSHAWGGTPLYSLPKALLGLKILQPSYKKILIYPSLLGLDWAKVELPTPYGNVVCEMKKGKKPKIVAPKEIEIILAN